MESQCGLTGSRAGARRKTAHRRPSPPAARDASPQQVPENHAYAPHPVGPQLQQPAASVAGLPPAATTSGTRHAGARSPQFLAAPGGRPLQEPDYNSQSALAPPSPERRWGLRAQRCRWPRSRTSAGGSAAREARERPSPGRGSQSLSWGRVSKDALLCKSEGARLSRAGTAGEPSRSPLSFSGRGLGEACGPGCAYSPSSPGRTGYPAARRGRRPGARP